jgi:UDP-hydrolysing UDP-N-acetyl-D-glucosamine 2-epimerase
LQFIKSQNKKNISELSKKFKFNFSEPYILMTFHPVTIELSKLNSQLSSLAKAIKLSGYNCVITYPNADPKYKKIINLLKKIFDDKKKYKIIKNLGIEYYSSVLKNSKFIIGNSSSGIVEAATFNKPAINIGTRQKGKFMPSNVINSKNDKNEILKKINKAESNKFKKKIKNIKNPYEPKISIKALIKVILNIKVNDKLIRKKFVTKI